MVLNLYWIIWSVLTLKKHKRVVVVKIKAWTVIIKACHNIFVIGNIKFNYNKYKASELIKFEIDLFHKLYLPISY